MTTAVQFKLGNITVNNGESVATISGITNEFFDRGTALFVSGAALPVEATKGSGTSQLALINAWPFASVSNQPFVAFNTIEGLSEAMRLAGELGEQLAAIVESTSEFSSELLGETNATGWRSKLGLGSSATRNTGTDPNQVPLNSDLADVARTGSAADLIAGLLPNARISETLSAAQAYRRGNILGTVSHSGGIPTGAIIQTITNANGTAVRFASGDMIVRVSGTAVFVSGPLLLVTLTLPSTTINSDYRVALSSSNRQSSTANARNGVLHYRNQSTTSIDIGMLRDTSFAGNFVSGDEIFVEAIIFARWF